MANYKTGFIILPFKYERKFSPEIFFIFLCQIHFYSKWHNSNKINFLVIQCVFSIEFYSIWKKIILRTTSINHVRVPLFLSNERISFYLITMMQYTLSSRALAKKKETKTKACGVDSASSGKNKDSYYFSVRRE